LAKTLKPSAPAGRLAGSEVSVTLVGRVGTRFRRIESAWREGLSARLTATVAWAALLAKGGV
jgi:hypothetical protein